MAEPERCVTPGCVVIFRHEGPCTFSTEQDMADAVQYLRDHFVAERLIETLAYNLYLATLVGDPAPRVKRLYDRVRAPIVGDLVLEVSTIHDEARVGTRLGRLVRIAQEPVGTAEEWGDEPIPNEPVWYLELTDGRGYGWKNASFIAVPTTIDRHDGPFVSDPRAVRPSSSGESK